MGKGTVSTRRSVLTTVLTFAIATMAMAAGASVATPKPPVVSDTGVGERSEADLKDSADAERGPIERVHDLSQCGLADGAALTGNWTHGDYVSAVAVDGKTVQVREAAQSSCGKPASSSGHGRPDQVPGRPHEGDQGDRTASEGRTVPPDHAAAGGNAAAGRH
jgi:hypothetical protein